MSRERARSHKGLRVAVIQWADRYGAQWGGPVRSVSNAWQRGQNSADLLV